jgi:hypothetical protein
MTVKIANGRHRIGHLRFPKTWGLERSFHQTRPYLPPATGDEVKAFMTGKHDLLYKIGERL